MDYADLIRRAWQITWRYKFLWIFGILMALCGQGNSSRANFQMNFSGSSDEPPQLPELPPWLADLPIAAYVIAGLLVLLIFWALSIIVGAISRSALIRAAARAEAGEELSLAQSWRDGLAKAVPVGLLQLLLSIPMLILIGIVIALALVLFLPLVMQLLESPEEPPPLENLLTLIPFFFAGVCGFLCFNFIIQLVVALFLTFGSRAIVLEDQGVLASFGRSWQLFMQNLGSTIILAVIIIVITFVLGLILALPAAALLFPVMFGVMGDLASGSGLSLLTVLLVVVVGLGITLVFGVITGIFQVFSETLWTLAYRAFLRKAV
jgi:hypothetical protein